MLPGRDVMEICDGMHPMNVLAVLMMAAVVLMLIGGLCAAVCFSERKNDKIRND